jgi:CRISPR-associated protein Csh1
MGYVPESGNEEKFRELLIAGLFADNLLFEKSVKGVE